MPPVRATSADAVPEGAPRPKSCFVISPIGSEGSPTRARSDKVLKHVIRKALEPQYRVERADELNLPGTISVQIVERVFEADLVVADLSEPNPNVFYELAIRHATKKPSVHIVASGEKLPFDINQIRAVQFDIGDPDSVEEAQTRLKEQVEAIEAGEAVVTPVQIAQSLTSLETGEDRDKQIFEVLQGLAGGISTLREDLFDAATQIVAALWDASKVRGLTTLGTLAYSGPPLYGIASPPRIAPEESRGGPAAPATAPSVEAPGRNRVGLSSGRRRMRRANAPEGGES